MYFGILTSRPQRKAQHLKVHNAARVLDTQGRKIRMLAVAGSTVAGPRYHRFSIDQIAKRRSGMSLASPSSIVKVLTSAKARRSRTLLGARRAFEALKLACASKRSRIRSLFNSPARTLPVLGGPFRPFLTCRLPPALRLSGFNDHRRASRLRKNTIGRKDCQQRQTGQDEKYQPRALPRFQIARSCHRTNP